MYSNSPSAQTGTRIYWQCASRDEIFANVNIKLVRQIDRLINFIQIIIRIQVIPMIPHSIEAEIAILPIT